MQRKIVQVMQVQMSQVKPGDICNRNREESKGWFLVKEVHELPNGDVAVIGLSDKDSINGGAYDIVGVQISKPVEVPDATAFDAAA